MINRDKLEHILEYAKQQRHIGLSCKVPPEDMVEIMERLLNAGNSPVIPDGYVMVPKEPTRDILDEFDSIIDYGAEDSEDAWRRLLAAAQHDTPALNPVQSVLSVQGWIPVSERMPQNDVSVLTFDGMYKRVHHAMYGHWQCWEPEKITHWMPLPASPQEVNHG